MQIVPLQSNIFINTTFFVMYNQKNLVTELYSLCYISHNVPTFSLESHSRLLNTWRCLLDATDNCMAGILWHNKTNGYCSSNNTDHPLIKPIRHLSMYENWFHIYESSDGCCYPYFCVKITFHPKVPFKLWKLFLENIATY